MKGPGRFLASYESALDAALCIVAALYEREATGQGRFIDVAMQEVLASREGQFIDVSAVESMSSMIGDSIMQHELDGHVPTCDGNRHADMAPHGAYSCRNGEWLSIAVSSDAAWQQLANAMGQPQLAARFTLLATRKANEAELDQLIADWTAHHDATALAEQLQQCGVAAAKSASSVDLVSDPHLWARGFFREVSDGEGGRRAIVGPAWAMTRGAEIRDGAPRLGEHNAYVFGELLGLSPDKQQELVAAGITR